MIQAVKARTSVLAIFLALLSIGYTFAQNKVVVVPLGGEEKSGIKGYVRVVSSTGGITLDPGQTRLVEAFCPGAEGEKSLLGGGGSVSEAITSTVSLFESYPINDGRWISIFRNNSAFARDVTLTAYAICAEVDEA
ncbi:MAG: hypothetical protein AAF402_06340 [Pseudomonadota bacterium]